MLLLPSWTKSNGIEDGSVIDALPYCKNHCQSNSCRKYYSEICDKPGFHQCPKGLSSYVITGEQACVYSSMRVKGYYQKGCDSAYNRGDSSESITPVINQALAVRMDKQSREQRILKEQVQSGRTDSKELFHDVKKLTAQIRNKSESIIGLDDDVLSVKSNMSDKEIYSVLQDVKSIGAMAGIISSRFELYDLTQNLGMLSLGTKRTRVIYQKFHKAKYILDGYMGKRTTVVFDGTSKYEYNVSQSFDVLPFILLENAIKYSPDIDGDSQQVTVSFREEHNNLYITITSIGPCCAEEDISHLFERGFRGKSASQINSGSGLGLYIAKQLCDEHKIDISIKSKQDRRIRGNVYGPFSVFLTFFGDQNNVSHK